MSLSTSLKCPRCGHCAQTAKVILPGAAIRCPRCNSTFRFVPSNGGLVESVAAVGNLDAHRLQGAFRCRRQTEDRNLKPRKLTLLRVLNESNERLPPRATGPTPAGSKKPVLDGKPLPFHGPRRRWLQPSS